MSKDYAELGKCAGGHGAEPGGATTEGRSVMVKRHEIPEDRIMADAVDMFPPDVTVACECGEWVSLIADGTPAPCPVCGRNVWARLIVQAWVEDSQP